jgi:hypothetical protein
MTLEIEGAVGDGVHRDEALGGTRRFEVLHPALPSAEWLVRNLGPVVHASPLLMLGVQADLLESGSIGAKLVGHEPGGSETLLPEQLADELAGRGLVPPALDQDLQHLALIVDRPPQVHLLAGDPHHHLIEMPA